VSGKDTEVEKLMPKRKWRAQKAEVHISCMQKVFCKRGSTTYVQQNRAGKQIGICGWFCPVS